MTGERPPSPMARENALVILAEIRRVLAEFDEEHGDPEDAMDEINDILTGA